MKTSDITFRNMVHKLPEAIPELKAAYQAQIEWWGEEEPAAHPAYSRIVTDTIKKMFRTDAAEDAALLRKIFDFLELLANHPEEHVQEVVHNSVCEALCSDEAVLQKTQRYMGPTVKEFCKSISTWEPPHNRADA